MTTQTSGESEGKEEPQNIGGDSAPHNMGLPSASPADDDDREPTGDVEVEHGGTIPSDSPQTSTGGGVTGKVQSGEALHNDPHEASTSQDYDKHKNSMAHNLPQSSESGVKGVRRRRQYSRDSSEVLLQNLLGLATSLLQLLSGGSSRRDAVAKSLLAPPAGELRGVSDAEAIARAASDILGAGLDPISGVWREGGETTVRPWGPSVREGALSVLGNLALEERTAAVAAASAASPHLAMLALEAAARAAQTPHLPPSPQSRTASRACPRMVQSAPTTLLIRAASLLCNHMRVVPQITSGASARAQVAALRNRDIGSGPEGDDPSDPSRPLNVGQEQKDNKEALVHHLSGTSES